MLIRRGSEGLEILHNGKIVNLPTLREASEIGFMEGEWMVVPAAPGEIGIWVCRHDDPRKFLELHASEPRLQDGRWNSDNYIRAYCVDIFEKVTGYSLAPGGRVRVKLVRR